MFLFRAILPQNQLGGSNLSLHQLGNSTNLPKENKPNKIQTSNLLDTEFKTLVIRMLSKLRGRVNELSHNFNKEIGNIKMEIYNIKMDLS